MGLFRSHCTFTDMGLYDATNVNIHRRLNPKLPPRDKACEHQLNGGHLVAECSEYCENEHKPDGSNIPCTWDKNSGSNGSSVIHITRPLEFLMRKFRKAQERTLEGQIRGGDANWFKADDCCFFLNANGNAFPFISMKAISDFLGVDVTAYTWRYQLSLYFLSSLT